MNRKCMIFAAGLGTRLKPLTDRMPKALVPIADKPLLEILMEKLHANGFNDIVINVHHFADMIEDFVPTSEVGRTIHVAFSDERQELLETGGGIRHAAALLNDTDRFLIHNVDILSNVNLENFWKQGENCEALLLVSQRSTQRYLLFNDDMRLVGWTNIKTGEVRSPFTDIKVDKCTMLAFAGIHQMSTSLLPMMQKWPSRFSIIDFYLNLCAQHDIRGYIQPGLQLMDVGKLDTLAAAEEFIKEI